MNDLLEGLRRHFADRLVLLEPFGQHVAHLLYAADIVDVVSLLKARGFSLLLDVTAVDRLGREPRFDVVYHLYHLELKDWLRLKLQVGGDPPEVPSVTSLFKAANWAEREVYDMFGIVFRGHPDLRRILMPDDWQYHPLRKDYPITGVGPLPPLARE